ncbi:MAG: hypothetical protein LBP39_03185, partial [Rickettsiales bacterium]|nr:hypothetical protein [Rickettsiales bacterium]
MIDNRVYAAGNKSNNSSKAATGNNSRKRGKNKRIGEGAESSAEGLRAEIKTPTKGETIITSPKAGDKSHIGTLLREILDDESRKNQGEQQDTSEIEEDKRKEDNPFADGLGEYYDELVKKDSRNGIEVADENNSVKGDSDLIGTKEEQLVSDKKVSKVIENLSNDTEFVRTMGETFGMDISKLRDAAVALDDNSVDKVENNLSSSLMVEKRSSEESNNPLSKSLDSSLAPVRNNLTKEEEEALNDKNKPLMAGLDNSGNNKEKLSGIEEEERQRLVDKEREAREIEDRKRNEHFGKLLRDSIAKEAANKKKAEEAEKQRQKKEKEELDRGFAEYYAGRDEALKRDQIEKERQDERLVIENPDLIIVKSSEEEEKLGPVDKKINKEDNLNDSKDEKEIIEGNRSQYLPFYDTIFEKGVPSEPNNDPTKKIVSSRGLATITDDEITDGDDEGSKTSDNDNEEGSKEKEKGSKKRRGKESKKIEKEEESPEPEVRGEEGEKEEER